VEPHLNDFLLEFLPHIPISPIVSMRHQRQLLETLPFILLQSIVAFVKKFLLILKFIPLLRELLLLLKRVLLLAQRKDLLGTVLRHHQRSDEI
jgi:hypothetical protein